MFFICLSVMKIANQKEKDEISNHVVLMLLLLEQLFHKFTSTANQYIIIYHYLLYHHIIGYPFWFYNSYN